MELTRADRKRFGFGSTRQDQIDDITEFKKMVEGKQDAMAANAQKFADQAKQEPAPVIEPAQVGETRQAASNIESNMAQSAQQAEEQRKNQKYTPGQEVDIKAALEKAKSAPRGPETDVPFVPNIATNRRPNRFGK
jgi:hypothetical protein